MKNIFIIFIVLYSANVWSKTINCKEHGNYLQIEEVGHDHVNHIVTLNGKIKIKELIDNNWFIEKALCTKEGFEIVASHIQYNEPTKNKFSIRVVGNDRYEIK